MSDDAMIILVAVGFIVFVTLLVVILRRGDSGSGWSSGSSGDHVGDSVDLVGDLIDVFLDD
jgi:hypothetical protein